MSPAAGAGNGGTARAMSRTDFTFDRSTDVAATRCTRVGAVDEVRRGARHGGTAAGEGRVLNGPVRRVRRGGNRNGVLGLERLGGVPGMDRPGVMVTASGCAAEVPRSCRRSLCTRHWGHQCHWRP